MKPSQVSVALAKLIDARLPVLLVGAPGVGKTDLAFQAAALSGADVLVSHPVVEDPTDPKGLPWPDKESGTAIFLPIGTAARALRADKPTVWLVDDLGQAAPAVQAGYMQWLLARRVGDHILPDCVTFIAATNRRSDRAGVQGLLEPVKSRFATILNVEVDLDDWVRWALAAGLPTELIAFIRFRPSLLHDFKPTLDLQNSPSPRTVANVGRLMGIGLPAELEYDAYAGAAGEGFAAEFVGFLRIFRDLPNPDAILLNPDTAVVPDSPAVLYALTGALARKASDQNADRLFRYYNRLPAEFSVLAARDSVAVCPAITGSRGFIEWSSAHASVLL